MAIALVLTLAAAEGVARFYLGLGDPPLSLADPDVEYRFKPGTYRRFGNRVHYNHYSMRSDDFPEHKTMPKERRILVLGDSVINGGALTDDADVGTRLLQAQLQARWGVPTIVGNVSAGSWGPTNQAAYLRKFGWFDADVIVLVESGHDATDASTFTPIVGISKDFPDRKPISALWEGATRYTTLFESLVRPEISTGAPVVLSEERARELCADAMREMLDNAATKSVRALVVSYRSRDEIDAETTDGQRFFQEIARTAGVPYLDLREPMLSALKAGQPLYRPNDPIHPSSVGQALIAKQLEDAIVRAFSEPLRVGPRSLD